MPEADNNTSTEKSTQTPNEHKDDNDDGGASDTPVATTPQTTPTSDEKSTSTDDDAKTESLNKDNTTNEELTESQIAMKKAEEAVKAAEAAEADAKLAAKRAASAKAEAEAVIEKEYKALATQIKSSTVKKNPYTYKRESEAIFRRDMGEPEFFLDKKDRFPRPILTPQQQESLTRQAETPRDQTPEYIPEHVLSPEFKGLTNYERGVDSYLQELYEKLNILKKTPNHNVASISKLKSQIAYLESLHENYYLGMNVFRTAKGGRSKITAR